MAKKSKDENVLTLNDFAFYDECGEYGTCRLIAYFHDWDNLTGEGWVTVMCSDQQQISDADVTNSLVEIAKTFCELYKVPLRRCVWIEHYPAFLDDTGREFPALYSFVNFQMRCGELMADFRPMHAADWMELGIVPPSDYTDLFAEGA